MARSAALDSTSCSINCRWLKSVTSRQIFPKGKPLSARVAGKLFPSWRHSRTSFWDGVSPAIVQHVGPRRLVCFRQKTVQSSSNQCLEGRYEQLRKARIAVKKNPISIQDRDRLLHCFDEQPIRAIGTFESIDAFAGGGDDDGIYHSCC